MVQSRVTPVRARAAAAAATTTTARSHRVYMLAFPSAAVWANASLSLVWPSYLKVRFGYYGGKVKAFSHHTNDYIHTKYINTYT